MESTVIGRSFKREINLQESKVSDTSDSEKTDEKRVTPSNGIVIPQSVFINTQFGGSVSEDSEAKHDLKEPRQHVGTEEMVQKKRERAPVCPRATLEVGHAQKLLSTIEFTFSEDQMNPTILQTFSEKLSASEPEPILEQEALLDPDAGRLDPQALLSEPEPVVTLEQRYSQPEPVESDLGQHPLESLMSGNEPVKEVDPNEVRRELPRELVDALRQHFDNGILVEDNIDVATDFVKPSELPQEEESEESLVESTQDRLDRLLPLALDAQELSWGKFEDLAEKGAWNELSFISADAQDANPDEAKLWWIYSQEQLGSLSALLLSAPLKELIDVICNSIEHPLRAQSKLSRLQTLTARLVNQLLNHEDGLLEAYSLLTAVECIAQSLTSFNMEWQKLWAVLSNKEKYTLTTVEKGILAEASKRMRLEGGAKPIPAAEPEGEFGLVPIREIEREQYEAQGSAYFAKGLFFLIFLTIFCIGVSYLLLPYFMTLHDTKIAHINTILPDSQSQLLLPAHSTIGAGRLGGLLLDAGIQEQLKTRPQTVPVSAKNPRRESKPSAVNTVKKTTIDTTGPVEPAGLKALIQQQEQQVIQQRRIGKDFVRDVGRDMTDPHYRSRTQIGTVQVPEVYETIVDTVILREPSYESAVLERVKRGSRIRVVESIGDWLRLSARDGKIGYILKQDAVRKNSQRS